jgi:hydrogenase maturation protease
MLDLRTQLANRLRERACFVGLGNPTRGDDGVGLRLAEAIGNLRRSAFRVVLAGLALERWAPELARGDGDPVVFLDAVDFGGSPGSVVWLEAEQIRARFPQVSTHRLSLGVWAQWLEASGVRQVGLLGVQPGSLRMGDGLSAPVAATVKLLTQWIEESDWGRMALMDDRGPTVGAGARVPTRPDPARTPPPEQADARRESRDASGSRVIARS